MERRTSGHAVRAVLLLIAVAALLAPVFVLRAIPTGNLADVGLDWVAAVLNASLLCAAGAATVASLVSALRHGSLAFMLLAGASAALVGGSLGLLAGAASMTLPVVASAAFTLGAVGASRAVTMIAGHRARVAAAGLILVLAEAAVLTDVLPPVAAMVDPYRPFLMMAAAIIAGLAAIVAATRDLGPAAAALAVGATALAVARPDGVELLLGTVALGGAALLTGRSVVVLHAPPAADGDGLPGVVMHLSEGVLRFDGHLRLRAWNPAAAHMLGIDAAGEGTRLEDLLGLTLPQLPAGAETVLHHTAIDAFDLSIHRETTSIIVVVREPPVSGDAERLGRELRGTIEELLQARRTVDLQRAELDRATTTDPLTGVASRIAIVDRLRTEVAQARRYRHPVAVLLIDVDHFGEVNIGHGIEGGDAVLREIALRVRLRVRAADALGRSGSDGFLSILPHTDEAGAATFADTLRRRIGERPIAIGEAGVAVTVSVGVAVMRPAEDLDLDGLMARAEDALESARSTGGDRIALDRLHGLARLDPRSLEPDETADGKSV